MATRIERLLTLFADVLFAVSLFAVWGLLTLIGVLVEQGRDASFYAQNYAPALARLVLRLDLDNIYHSPAYIGIIGLILVSLAVCTFKRVIPARLPPLRAVKIDKIPLNATIELRGNESDARTRLEQFFSKRGWAIRRREIDGTEWSFADRHNWARRGVLIAHIGFVIISAGTTLYWWKGFSGESIVLTGQTVMVPRSGAVLHLDRFSDRFEPIRTRSGIVYQPLDYVSDMHVAGQDGVTTARILRVNHPLDIDDTLYYQESYGYAVRFAVTHNGRPVDGVPTMPIKEGDAFTLGSSTRGIRYGRFIGTLERRPHGELDMSRDPRPRNPGVLLDAFDGDQLLGRVLVPIGTSLDLGDGYRVTVSDPTLFTVIQYRHDPGIPLVGIGAFVLLAGLCISFYLLPARLYITITPHATTDICTVGIAATTVKGYDIFEESFRDIVDALRGYESGLGLGLGRSKNEASGSEKSGSAGCAKV